MRDLQSSGFRPLMSSAASVLLGGRAWLEAAAVAVTRKSISLSLASHTLGSVLPVHHDTSSFSPTTPLCRVISAWSQLTVNGNLSKL